MAQILVKYLHSPIPCEVLLKSFHYGSWPKVLWNHSIRLFPWGPFKISPLSVMAQIIQTARLISDKQDNM